MAISVKGSVTAGVALSTAQAVDLTSGVGSSVNYQVTDQFESGNNANEINEIFSKTYVGTSDVTIDLEGGSAPTNPHNEAIDLSGGRGILIKNLSTTAGHNLVVGNAASNGWDYLFGGSAHTIKVPPGGTFMVTSPVDKMTVDATHKALKIARGGNSINFNVIIFGTTG